MELLKLKKRLVLAKRGHKLLQDKLEELMRRFIVLLKDIDKTHNYFQTSTEAILKDLLYCRITTSENNFKDSLSGIKSKIILEISKAKIMNVEVPVFNLKELALKKEYDFLTTSPQLDIAVYKSKKYIELLLSLSQLLKTLDILSFEIERTRRRVNALQYKLIPSILDTIRYITEKLNEFERGNLVRLMRVKEIVRSH